MLGEVRRWQTIRGDSLGLKIWLYIVTAFVIHFNSLNLNTVSCILQELCRSTFNIIRTVRPFHYLPSHKMASSLQSGPLTRKHTRGLGFERSPPSPAPLFHVSHYRKFQKSARLDWVWSKPFETAACPFISVMVPFALVYQNNTLHWKEYPWNLTTNLPFFCMGTGNIEVVFLTFLPPPASFCSRDTSQTDATP